MKEKKWIKGALKGHKKGALHRQLGVPESLTLSKDLLNHIKNAPLGSNVNAIGRKNVKVTRLLKRRAVLALNLEN